MDLRFPAGSAGLFASWAGSASDLTVGDDASVPATPEALRELLAALAKGWIEYVGLHEEPIFLQIAGDGDGPYMIQYSPGDPSAMMHVPSGGSLAQATSAMERVLARDPGWHAGLVWQPFDPGGRTGGRRRRR